MTTYSTMPDRAARSLAPASDELQADLAGAAEAAQAGLRCAERALATAHQLPMTATRDARIRWREAEYEIAKIKLEIAQLALASVEPGAAEGRAA